MNISDFLNSDEIDGIIRHAMTAAGTTTVVSNNFDPTQWQTIIGAAVVVVSVALSWANKKYLKSGGTAIAPAPAPTA